MASSHREPTPARNRAGPQLRTALALLLRAWEYTSQSRRPVWAYAVEIAELRAAGLTTVDLRWLLSKEYGQHAVEETKPGARERVFGPAGQVQFHDRSCFVLTKTGARFARRLAAGAASEDAPFYDRDRRQLWLGDVLVKRFKQRAPDQHRILSAFQKLGWPPKIEDPLSPKPLGQYAKLRLRDAIKRLNRHQQNRLIRFRGDGTGRCIVWELIAP